MKTQLRVRVCLALLLALTLASVPASFGQKKPAAAPAAQTNDADYTAQIKKYTTDPMFLTELVDHLPASATVPSPQKVLGYVIGTPEKLTYTKDAYRYYRELAKASPRVRVWNVGTTEEGREFLLVAVSDEANLTNLDRYKQITNELADPRKITDADAAQLIKDGKPFYWASASIHSPETGSVEMLMELAYRLAVEDSPFVQNIRKNLIVLLTPVVEVDGRDMMVDNYNYRKANPDKPTPNLVYWGKYVAHDNNRDSITQSLALSKVMMKVFLDFKPQVLHDLHESVPFLYTSTGMGPYNAWLDPITIDEWQKMSYYEIEEMTKRNVPGVWTHGFYDGWAPNYMFYVANGHNSIGRFYETFGNGGADTRERTVGAQSQRAWFRPNPPLPRVNWSIRNNINMQQSALLFAMQYTANNKEEFLNNFYLKSKRSVAKASTEGPAAWVILNDGKRPVLAAQLADLMQRQGAEVQVLTQDTEIKSAPALAAPRSGGGPTGAGRPGGAPAAPPAPATTKIPAGSYVLRMDQPYSRMVDMLLDTQYYSVDDPRPYDDTGWTLGPLRNVATLRVTDDSILKAAMTPAPVPLRFTGSISGSATKFFVINANAEPALATFRFKLKDVKMFAGEDAFEADNQKFNAGSFIIPVEGNPSDLRAKLDAAAKDSGLRVHATDADLKVDRHPLAVPRIALVHSWTTTQNEGWFRLGLEEWQIPYTYISDKELSSTPNLKSKFDVILYPPGPGNVGAFVWGVRKRMLFDGTDFGGPIPWKQSDVTPNVGTSPDQADDIRGGMGYEGLANLKKFIEDGGVFIPITSTAVPVVQLGLVEGITVADTRNLQARGAVMNAAVADNRSPIAYGYDDRLAVYFSQAPVFRVGGGGGGFGGGGGGGPFGAEPAGRPSGRGSLTDPDIPQGRPWNPPTPARPGQEEGPGGAGPQGQQGPTIPTRMTPRIILRFAAEPNLLVSGMLAGGSELANAPAVVDIPLGRGHVVMFSNNPMWRQETQGSFMLLLNAALNFDNLHVGRREAPARGGTRADDLGDDYDWWNWHN